jgi:hypothetical protein
VELRVLHGELGLQTFRLTGFGEHRLDAPLRIPAGREIGFDLFSE